jgi:rubrerythrin
MVYGAHKIYIKKQYTLKGDLLNLEEAIKTAIDYETKVRNVYKEAEETAENPTGKRVFNMLVKEEQYHLEYLESRLEEWQNSGEITIVNLETSIPSQEIIDTEANKLKIKLEAGKIDKKYSDIELQMLRRALEVEQETSEFYKRMVLELPKSDQKLFIRFVEIEEGHKAIVQAEIDSVTGLGYWFDIPEFDLSG